MGAIRRCAVVFLPWSSPCLPCSDRMRYRRRRHQHRKPWHTRHRLRWPRTHRRIHNSGLGYRQGNNSRGLRKRSHCARHRRYYGRKGYLPLRHVHLTHRRSASAGQPASQSMAKGISGSDVFELAGTLSSIASELRSLFLHGWVIAESRRQVGRDGPHRHAALGMFVTSSGIAP